MNVILIGLGLWCAISVPAAFVIARLCGLNRSRAEVASTAPAIEQLPTRPAAMTGEKQLA